MDRDLMTQIDRVAREIQRQFPGTRVLPSDAEFSCSSAIDEDGDERSIVLEVHLVDQQRKPELRSFSGVLRRQGIWTMELDLVLVPYTRDETLEYFPEVGESLDLTHGQTTLPDGRFTADELEELLSVEDLHTESSSMLTGWVVSSRPSAGKVRPALFIGRDGQPVVLKLCDIRKAA